MLKNYPLLTFLCLNSLVFAASNNPFPTVSSTLNSIIECDRHGTALEIAGKPLDALATYCEGIYCNPNIIETRFLSPEDQIIDEVASAAKRAAFFESFAKPQWQGENLAGKTLLVLTEKGLGDSFQFCRYLSGLKSITDAHRILFRPQKLLADVLKTGTFTHDVEWVEGAIDPSSYDYVTTLLSLPHLLASHTQSIPCNNTAYLCADEASIAKMQSLITRSVRPNIGLCFFGDPKHPYNPTRTVPLAQLAKLSAVGNLYSLQKAVGIDQLPELRRTQPDLAAVIIDLDPACSSSDFNDTAAAIACLDVVVTIDSALAHLAGAMGKPTILLLPVVADWRWINPDPTIALPEGACRSLWYRDNFYILRQITAGEWESVIERASRLITQLFAD